MTKNENNESEAKRLMCKRYEECGILRAYWDLEMDNFEGDKEALDKIKKYINKIDIAYNNGIGVYLFGNFGTGKTSLANIILKEALKTGRYSVYNITLSTLIDKYMDRFSEKSQSFINNVINKGFLSIDDVGKEYRNDSGFVETKLNDVLRYRNGMNFPTILTSNKPVEDIKEYGQSIYSIIKGFYVPVHVLGRDYRIENISYQIKSILE